MINKFLRYYEDFESRPIFESVENMLKWAGLYDLTTRTLGKELLEVGLSPSLVQELVTVSYMFPLSDTLFLTLTHNTLPR